MDDQPGPEQSGAHQRPSEEQPSGRDRGSELERNLEQVRSRIATAAAARPAGKADPELIVVTKFHPAADVLLLAELGVRDVGENRDQEAAAKSAEVTQRITGATLRWHFIGQLQSNKAKSVAGYAYSVHSVDRAGLVKALSAAVTAEQQRTGRADLLCFVQVNLDPALTSGPDPAGPPRAASRGGVAAADVMRLAELIELAPGLRLAGVMAVAPRDGDADEAFARLAKVSAAVVQRFPQATAISAGMSQDLERAIAAGATHLRVGSDILGPRPALR
ncbi:YggS family pyridoxal phosphate-dependent enzyme [Paeniglutamicibacter antarcticus]|uniref:Pyridoxal phosphate homeostasis protein n=1 Tax=Arthrobacter terrae TaxID=2935737 RepID=A0A931CU29_9MICC|nr:YggS family pyridoxal phosphate-dependent enzyme [Arthrobacter terrae]MBG0741424.1 YggS family pyridoxal phosphate-dependent enzyme [Arthrobacter terrae]